MDRDDSLQRLKQALRDHHEALEELGSALLEFEESVEGEAPERPEEAWACSPYRTSARSWG